ncbi:hypothetical protein [Deinococcus hohokamensis]|uniref:DUF3806 domain-containing protein n=1 Tax=Deinococcus hohokamensis TaxID=309883 RepID=A0ABV9IEA4_9DEIO
MHNPLQASLPADLAAGLTAHAEGLRARFLKRQTLTPEDLSVTLRWAEQAMDPDQPASVKSLAKQAQHLAWLLASPWPEALLEQAVVTRPDLGGLQIGGMPVFVRTTCAQKVEPTWRLVLGAAAPAATSASYMVKASTFPEFVEQIDAFVSYWRGAQHVRHARQHR